MIDYWKEFADDEQEDDSVCRCNACDHPCCPEHGDPEDEWQMGIPAIQREGYRILLCSSSDLANGPFHSDHT